MKSICKLITALLALIITADASAQNFTNKGKEFWVGYGHHQYMEPSCDGNSAAANDMNMVLYLSAEQPAKVTVTIDNSAKIPGFPSGWIRTYNIPANTVISTENLPKGGTDAARSGSDPNFDARLFDNPYPLGTGGEGIWKKKGIHIVSDVPIVAYAHIYGGVSSGATMLLPIETWGYSYTSINSEQRDADRSYSWMYVIAKDNNTRVRITPSAASRRGKPANVPFTVDLMKGEIYQYVAESDCATGNGPELTGTTVKSIVGADGQCHPVAVFSGSSRTGGETLTCGTGSGRDNDIQQNFPEHAWGRRYLTAPFSKASSGTSLQANQFQTSVYKIVLKDPSTRVTKNGIPITFSGTVYSYSSSTADYIEADKPIMVAQFMSGTSTCSGGSQGDPEMIYLSPIEQAINKVGFYRNTKEAIVANYLTLIVPTGGLPSLRIDNSQFFNYTYPHPNLPGFTVVVKGWQAEQAQCLVTCDSAFNAFTYGLGGAESYGYNAGTYLKNLAAEGEIYNKPDTSNAARPFTCTGTPMEITALVAYKPSSMNWKLSFLGSVVSPNTDVFVSNPIPVDSIIVGATKYYRYKLPGTYVFNTAGTYDLPIVNTSLDIDNCALQETVQIKLIVKPRPSSDFTFTNTGCRTDSVVFTGPASTGTYTAAGWTWDFGDATGATVKDPKKLYGASGDYLVKLVVTSAEGCLSDTTKKTVTINPARKASIFASVAEGCEGTSITFNDTTTVTSGTFYWDLGTGTPVSLTSNTPQTVVYPAPGDYTIKHVIYPTANCVSDTVTKTITIYAKPSKPMAASPVMYCQNATATALTAIGDAGNTLTWYNNPALTGGSVTAPVPSTATAGTVYYYVTQTTVHGCVSDTTRIAVTITPSLSSNSITSDQIICSGTPARTLNGSTPSGGTGTYSYQWQQSADGTTWSDISGATAVSYDPGILSTGVTKFRRVVASGLCSNTSNTVSITVETNLSNYDISASQAICEGSAPSLLVGQTPTGGTGTYTYQWQVSGDGTTWSDISGATNINYQPGNLTTKTYFRRITSGGNCPAISSAVVISINPLPNGTITAPASQVCEYNAGSVSFTPTAGGGPYTIQLQVTTPAGTTNTQPFTFSGAGPHTAVVIPANSTPGNYTVVLQSITNGTCSRTTGFSPVSIEIIATPKPTFSPAAPVICSKDSVTITVSGANYYSWSPATGLNTVNGPTVKASPATTTTYTVTGGLYGCTGTATVTVTVNSLPSKPVVTSPVMYCQNATAAPLNATAGMGNTLTWYTTTNLTGGTSTAPTPSTTTAGTLYYYVTQTNANGCVGDTSKISVSVFPQISNNSITADQTLCQGVATSPLAGTSPAGGDGTYAFQWEQSADGGTTWNAIAGATASNYNAGTLTPGTTKFRRVVASGLCSSTSNTVTIIVEQSLSNYDISGAQTVCEGSAPSQLVGQTPTGGTGTYTYQWESSTDSTSFQAINGATSKDYQPGVLTMKTWFRRITSGGRCPAISSAIPIIVNATPNGAITGPAGICAYEAGDITFTASKGAAPYTIQLQVTAPGGGTSTITKSVPSNAPYTFNVLPLNSAPGTYTITLTSVADGGGCPRTTGLNSVTVTVTAKPTLTTSGDVTICEGASSTVTVRGATTYTWSSATGLSTATGNSVTASPITTTTYTVTGATNGCTATADVKVTVIPRPAKPVVTPLYTYCLDATATQLSATGGAGNTMTWFSNPSLSGGSATAPTPSTAVYGTLYYFVNQTNSSGCVSDTARIAITVFPNPVVDFSMPAGVCAPNGSAQFTNESSITDGSTMNYSWNFGDGSALSTQRDPIHIYATAGSYNVNLSVSSNHGCTGDATKVMSAFVEKPVADFSVNPTALCQGQDNTFLDLSTPAGTINKWNWNFGDGTSPSAISNPRHRYNRPGTYSASLVVTNTTGCVSDPVSKDVIVYLKPVVDAGKNFVVPTGSTVQFQATANDTTLLKFVWTPATGLSSATALRPTLVVTQNQVYKITATGDGGCTASDTLSVSVLNPVEVPNAFSPNGDGINDRWEIPNLLDYPGAKVEIYNRWGQLVYQSYGYNKPWDGTFKGQPLPLGAYYYVITLNNGFKPVTGSVTIIK